jgi:hypothetical protein
MKIYVFKAIFGEKITVLDMKTIKGRKVCNLQKKCKSQKWTDFYRL